MMLSVWGAVALIVPVSFFVGAVVQRVLFLRQRHGGGKPLPAWLITAERASPELRAVVAKVARSAATDAIQEWDTLPPGLKVAINWEIEQRLRLNQGKERST